MKPGVEKNTLDNLFDFLSDRFYKENHLSDFLYALINGSAKFRELFYRVLNKKKDKKLEYSNFWEAKREFSVKFVGRPDFMIKHISGEDLVVEVKKYDTNFHKEYNKIPNSIKCLLTINECEINEENTEWILFRWKDLLEEMDESEDPLIKAVSILFKKGCNMEDIKKVINKEIPSLLYLNRMIKNALWELKINVNSKAKSSFDEDCSGYCFEYKKNNYTYYPWLGFNYNDSPNPFGLMFWLNPDHKDHIRIAEIFRKEFPLKEKYFSNFNSNQVVIMTLTKKEEWNTFFEFDTKEDQINYIKKFAEFNLNMISQNS